MLAAHREAILARLGERALVLDVGGGAQPFERADWVLDLMPYGDRGLYGPAPDPERERFSERTWVVRDICDREPWPFPDGMFDFAVCTHTLEDIRDPIYVASELQRVARAGYVEVPTRLEEQSFGFQGPWAGHSHHRWLVDIAGDELIFTFKPHVLHNRARNVFDADFRWALPAERRAQGLFWEGALHARERILMSGQEVDADLAGYVARHRPPRPSLRRRALARVRWALDTPRRIARRRAG